MGLFLNNFFRKLLVLISILFLINCGENIDPSTLNSEQLAIYNPERPSRDRKSDETRKTEQILTLAAIKPGMKVADIDAGNGYYTELFSSLVGNTGNVYMQNGKRYVKYYSDKIEDRLDDNRLPNVIRLDSGYNELKLPSDLDLIFISLSFHDAYVPQEDSSWNADISLYLSQIKNALKQGGRLIVIDHSANKGTGSSLAQGLHRIDEDFVKMTFESMGLKFAASSDLLRNPEDDRSLDVWNDSVRGKTDKFILIFKKSND